MDDYEPVASRIQRFYATYPNGAIHTEIVFDDGQRVVIKACVYRDITDVVPAAVDYAEEILTDRGVNSTSRIENACTSATGRAISIAAAGLAPSDWTKKPSREEMQKVERYAQGDDRPRTVANNGRLASAKQAEFIGDLIRKNTLDAVVPRDLTFDQASAAIESLKAGKLPTGWGMDVADDEEPF